MDKSDLHDINTPDGGASEEALARGHESEHSARIVPIAASSIGLLVLVGLVLWALVGFFNLLAGRYDGGADSPWADYREVPPSPRLQIDPAIDLYTMHEQENQRLYNYGWVNEQQGRVHIPITEAMRLVAERGLPVLPATDTLRPDSVLIPTESGYRTVRLYPERPGRPAPTFLGSSPEPYTPLPTYRRILGDAPLYLGRPDTIMSTPLPDSLSPR